MRCNDTINLVASLHAARSVCSITDDNNSNNKLSTRKPNKTTTWSVRHLRYRIFDPSICNYNKRKRRLSHCIRASFSVCMDPRTGTEATCRIRSVVAGPAAAGQLQQPRNVLP